MALPACFVVGARPPAPRPAPLPPSPAPCPTPRPPAPTPTPAPACGLRMHATAALAPTRARFAPPSATRPALAARRVGADAWQLAVARGRRTLGGVGVDLDGPARIFLHDLKVEPAARGAGLGASLVAGALRLGRAAGRRIARLIADDDGSGRLLDWYGRLGFVASGRGGPRRPELLRSTA